MGFYDVCVILLIPRGIYHALVYLMHEISNYIYKIFTGLEAYLV
jgi:hypothetical protein